MLFKLEPAESAMSSRIPPALHRIGFAEIRPERLCNHQFRVGNLPKQKVAHAHFAAGADQQVRVGNIPRVKMLRENLLGDISGIQFTRLNFLAMLRTASTISVRPP